MFNFFKREDPGVVKVSDRVWMSTEAKWGACAKMAKASDSCVFVCWFEQTHQSLTEYLAARVRDANVVLASDLSKTDGGKLYIFVEHYPLRKIEQKLFADLGLLEAHVLCGLDEPLFQQFGGERIVNVMERLGMNEDEIVGHTMVTKAIAKAQKKMGEKVEVETKTRSSEEWYEVNLKSQS
ncbi:MAG: hypothetical protein RLN86_13660 [Cyclobacteriaceae bacterium]